MIIAVACPVHQLAILLPTLAGVLAALIVTGVLYIRHSSRWRAVQRGALAGAITCVLVFVPAVWLMINSETACRQKVVYLH